MCTAVCSSVGQLERFPNCLLANMAVEECLGAGIEPLRAVIGAGADTLLSPASLADWEPSKQKLAWYDKKPSVEAAVESQTTEVK